MKIECNITQIRVEMSRSSSKSNEISLDHKIDCTNAFKIPKCIKIDPSHQSIVAQRKKINHIFSFAHIKVGKPRHYSNGLLSQNRMCNHQNGEIYQMTPSAIDLNEYGENWKLRSTITHKFS